MTWTDREVKAFTQGGVEPGEWVEVMTSFSPVPAPSSSLGTPRRRTG
ncbi:hypothetical protein [Streptomyces afghaniensis]